MDLGLSGKACIVTGATSGIGAAVARMLHAEGARVLLVARGQERLDAMVAELRANVGHGGAGGGGADARGGGADASGDGDAPGGADAKGGGTDVAGRGSVAAIAADVIDPDSAARIVAACESAFGRVDVLVNNAGTMPVAPLDELTDADWQEQWDLNVMASLRLMRAAAPKMVDGGWGRIVNVSSSAGKRPSLRNAAYAVAKAAQLSLSRVYADQLAGTGVLVNAVTPGPTASELWTGPAGIAAQSADRAGSTREDELAAAAAKIPLGRLGEPDEIASVVVFLCSDLASNVTGAAWSADGGSVPFFI